MPGVRGGYVASSFDGRDVPWHNDHTSQIYAQLYRPVLRDQGHEVDCCTSMALATAFEIVDKRQGESTSLSSLYHYYFARRSPRHLGPLSLRQALSAAAVYGFCKLELHDVPVTVRGALQKPSEIANNDAIGRRLAAYNPNTGTAGYFSLDGIDRLNNWKRTLSAGFPVIAGIWTQSSYWAGQGMLTNQAEPQRGAHAVCVVGFEDEQETFTVRDSRGSDFADGGEWNLAYHVVISSRIVESWTIKTLNYDD